MSHFLHRVSLHFGELIIAPIPEPQTDEEKAEYSKKCETRTEINRLLGQCLESFFFFYFILRKFLVVTAEAMPTMVVELTLCQERVESVSICLK